MTGGRSDPDGVLPPDDELVTRLRAGDEDAFTRMVTAWSGGLLSLARSVLGDREAAADVVQETWLAVVRGIDGFDGRAALRTWVSTIALNTARRRGAREGRSVPLSSLGGAGGAGSAGSAGGRDGVARPGGTDDAGPTVDESRFHEVGHPWAGDWRTPPSPWDVPAPEQAVLRAEVRSRITAAVAALPERQRTVLVLRDVQGIGPEDTATMLGISVANQRVLLHRARARTRARLAGETEDGTTEVISDVTDGGRGGETR